MLRKTPSVGEKSARKKRPEEDPDCMKAVFIADAHLKSSQDFNYRKLMRFLALLVHPSEVRATREAEREAGRPIPADDLYIGGDFFDFWFCRGREAYPEFQPVIQALTVIGDRGIRVHLAEGNHDFFLADYFTRMLGMEVFPDWATLHLDGYRVLFSHGDTVDRTNVRYLRLRKLLRSRSIYRLQRLVPLPLLWKIAAAGSAASKEQSRHSAERLSRILHDFSASEIQGETDAVILGHCHQPILKEFKIGDRRKYAVTLGDWIRHFSYLHYDDGIFRLCFFEPGENGQESSS